METKYNGWSNRSTWLTKLHLDNTSKEIATRAYEIAVQANTTKSFKSMLINLIQEPELKALRDEDGFDIATVNFRELWDNLEKINI